MNKIKIATIFGGIALDLENADGNLIPVSAENESAFTDLKHSIIDEADHFDSALLLMAHTTKMYIDLESLDEENKTVDVFISIIANDDSDICFDGSMTIELTDEDFESVMKATVVQKK